MRNEIEARDPTRLEEGTDVAAAAIAARHGMGSVAGQLKAYVITAPVGALRDRVDPFSVGANEVRSRALRKRLRRRSRIIRSSRRNLTGGIGDWFRARHNRTGNLPLFPGIFPDQLAPIVRNSADGERELVMARWGMPGPLQFGGQPVTNIRNVASPHWRSWLGTRNRCLVPATNFCEYENTTPTSRHRLS